MPLRGPVAEHPGGHRECGGSEGCEWPQVREQQVEPGPCQIHPLRDIDGVPQMAASPTNMPATASTTWNAR
jgi:hypothetical protein